MVMGKLDGHMQKNETKLLCFILHKNQLKIYFYGNNPHLIETFERHVQDNKEKDLCYFFKK